MRELAQLHINDKIQHSAAYAALAFLPALQEKKFRRLMYAALGLVILGVLLEFGQLLSVDRFFEIDDMIAHAAGICIGMAFERPMRGLTN